ncbi:MAG: glycosyltransferase [Gemmataceae bacterium]|nr:glycosyltransferase [Gemmataceae bacterium]
MLERDRPAGTVAYLGGVMALPERWAWCWSQMQEFNADFLPRIHYDRATVSYHAAARNGLAQRLRGDWLLMLDTDHEFEPDLVARMLHRMLRHELDVLSGFYQYKTHPHQPVVYRWGEPGKVRPIGLWGPECKLFRADAVGGGCLLVRRRVFDRIRKELNEQPFDIRHPYGEDISFCTRLRDLGIPLWVDARIEYHHLAVRPVLPEQFDADSVTFEKDALVVEGIAV